LRAVAPSAIRTPSSRVRRLAIVAAFVADYDAEDDSVALGAYAVEYLIVSPPACESWSPESCSHFADRSSVS